MTPSICGPDFKLSIVSMSQKQTGVRPKLPWVAKPEKAKWVISTKPQHFKVNILDINEKYKNKKKYYLFSGNG